jgi:hypothetical protein
LPAPRRKRPRDPPAFVAPQEWRSRESRRLDFEHALQVVERREGTKVILRPQ